jgi:hypothetical protein
MRFDAASGVESLVIEGPLLAHTDRVRLIALAGLSDTLGCDPNAAVVVVASPKSGPISPKMLRGRHGKGHSMA